MLCWGTKYDARDVALLVRRITEHAASVPSFVLLSDRDHPDLPPDIAVRRIPDFYARPEFLSGGCQAKLCLFQDGVLDADLPAIYVDLDTLIFGDIGAALAFGDPVREIRMLRGGILPFSRLSRILAFLTAGSLHARGNSSMVVFHPAHCGFIDARFRDVIAAGRFRVFRPSRADDRFISWAAQRRMRQLPTSFIVKFAAEFMMPAEWLVHLRSTLPWVRRRRARIVAITLSGEVVGPETLRALNEGDRLTDRRGRILIWTDRALGPWRRRIVSYLRAVQTDRPPPDGA